MSNISLAAFDPFGPVAVRFSQSEQVLDCELETSGLGFIHTLEFSYMVIPMDTSLRTPLFFVFFGFACTGFLSIV